MPAYTCAYILFLTHTEDPISQKSVRASEMAQLARVLAAKPEDLSSIPGTHVLEGGEPAPTGCLLSLPHIR